MTENRRIALNVAATYGRSLYALAVGLCCGRWALMALGEVDYGLMGLVGGLAGFVAFFNTLLASAVGRFYAVSVGAARKRGNESAGLEDCRKWFATALQIHTVVPVALVLIGYPLGLWMVKNFLTIPPDRISTCVWVWRFTCTACFFAMANVPFQAMYTAKQEVAELTVYSFVTTTLNACFLYFMLTHPGVWLAKFAAWTCALGVVPQLLIAVRAVVRYPECRLRTAYLFDGGAIVQVCRYVYARFIVEFSVMIAGQARALLVNKYMGPRYNAAVAIGGTVANQAMSLSGSVCGAMWPAIANRAGADDEEGVRRYCLFVCRTSPILILIFALPLMLEVDEVLRLWLVTPPPFAGELCVAILAGEVLSRLSDGHWMAVLSGGKGVVRYSHAVSIPGFAFVAVVWLLFSLGMGMWSLFVGIIVMGAAMTVCRTVMAQRILGYRLGAWIRAVVLPVLLTSAGAVAIGAMPRLTCAAGVGRLIGTTVLTETAFVALLWLFVLSADEKRQVRRKVGGVVAVLRRFRDFLGRVLVFLFRRNVVAHFGLPQRSGRILRGNVGDPYLFIKMERMVDAVLGRKNWISYNCIKGLSGADLFLINHFARFVLVGGHGLIMNERETARAGWLFNIPVCTLRKIRVPMVFASIGYNSFRGESPFGAAFRESINCCIEKSAFFGLRNEGSVRNLLPYVENAANRSKIRIQPCPTTMVGCFEPKIRRPRRASVAVCLAFDRFDCRFPSGFDGLQDQLLQYAETLKGLGRTVSFAVHCSDDLDNEFCAKAVSAGYEVRCLSDISLEEVEAFYSSQELVVGMRGHSLMIPWGLGVPVISLTTQDKQLFFMELIGHPEWSIEVDDRKCFDRLMSATTSVFDGYESVLGEMERRQSEFWKLTTENFKGLKL